MADVGGDDGFEDPVSPSSQLVSSATRKRTRGPSHGKYGHVPKHPDKILITPTGIEDSEAKAVMLALLRSRWPPGIYTWLQLTKTNEDWVKKSIEEFRRYYIQNSDMTNEEANAGIETYMKNQSRKMWSDEHTRVKKLMKQHGGTYEQHRPIYFKEEVWNPYCAYWRSEPFQKKSDVNMKNRGNLQFLHSSGSRSFALRMEDFKKKNDGKEPERVTFFRDTHTKKGIVDTGTTPAVDILKERYTEIVQQSPVDPTSDPSVSLQLWLQATGPPKKNRILGQPGVSAVDLLGTRRRTSRVATTASVPASSAASGTMIRPSLNLLSDKLFISAIDACCRALDSQPEQFNMTSGEAAEFASTVTGRDVTGSIPDDVRAQLVRVLVTVISDIMAQRQRDVGASQATSSHAEETASLSHD